MSSAKYILWGTKRGNQVFNHSADIPDSIIKTISRDIRGYINVNQPKVRFYSVEFIENYKVTTLYSSIYDWSSSPGFLAISTLVEFNAETDKTELHKNIYNLLSKMYEVYANNYLDSSFRLSKDREDVSKFDTIISSFSFQTRGRLTWLDSPNNNNYAVVHYDNDHDLDFYLNDTLRKPYQAYQKVFFFGMEHKGKHARLIDITSQVPPIEKEYTLDFNLRDAKGDRARDVSCEITINNSEKYLSIFTLPKLKENDSVDYKFSSPNYEDSRGSFVVTPTADDNKVSHTVTLIEKKYDVTVTVMGKFNKAYKNKDRNTLAFNNRSYSVPDGEVVLEGLTLRDANAKITIKDSKGDYQDRTESLLAHEIKKGAKKIKLKPIPTPIPRRKREDVSSGGSNDNISSGGSTNDHSKFNENAFGGKDTKNTKYNPQKVALLSVSVLFVLLAVGIGTYLWTNNKEGDGKTNTVNNSGNEEKLDNKLVNFKNEYQLKDSSKWREEKGLRDSINHYSKNTINITPEDSAYLSSMVSIIDRQKTREETAPLEEKNNNENKTAAQQQLNTIIKTANSGNVIDVKILGEKRKEAKELKRNFPNLDFSDLEGNYEGKKGFKELDDRLVNWKIFCQNQYKFKNKAEGTETCEILRIILNAKLSPAQNSKINNWIKDNLKDEKTTANSWDEYYTNFCN